jgi:TolA-binding protein
MATNAYAALLKSYSKSEKAPGALVRLVEISLLRKDKRLANVYYDKLKSNFSDEPETARASELIGQYGRK